MKTMETLDTRILNVRTEYQTFSQERLKLIQKNISKNFSILLFNVRTSGNVGMTIRSACLLGCREVIICGRKKYDARFTTGSHNYIPITYNDDILKVTIKTVSPGEFTETLSYNVNKFIEFVKANKFTPVFLEQCGQPVQEINWTTVTNPLIVVGNESCGIPMDFIKKVQKEIEILLTSIPQYSVMRSLNVSVAASIAMWEITKSLN
jgi:tRNA G18 (ribose-2'-O)-methylase SpoU